MRCFGYLVLVVTASGCAVGMNHAQDTLIGQDSFEIAARYGTPSSYRHHAELLQLNYGDEASGCRFVVLVDQTQRVVGWARGGARCPGPSTKPDVSSSLLPRPH